MRRVPVLLAIPLLVVCNGDPAPDLKSPSTDPGTQPVASTVVLLSDTDRLLRVAMALKGTRPTPEEFAAVQADPGALPGIVDTYLASPQFGATVRDIENQTLLVRVEEMVSQDIPPEIHWMDWAYWLNEEPLALIEYVVVNDRPYTDIVTMDQTVTNSLGTQMWAGIADTFDPDGPDWQRVDYTDGRPTAGILSTGGWNMQFSSTLQNAHRRGAAAAASALICTDYLSRDVQLGSVDLTDENAIDEAILYNPACVSCHQTMDPLAGFFWGFAEANGFRNGFPAVEWFPDDVDRGVNRTGRNNGYYGLGGNTMDDLGELIATDHRFTSCAARRYISWLSQIPLEEVPIERVAAAQQALVDGDLNLKAMARQIALSDEFAASHATDEAEATHLVGHLQTRPEQLERLMEDLTGFHWGTIFGGADGADITLPTNARRGYKVHGGGIDGDAKLVPTHMYSAPSSAFLRSFASEAAGHAVATGTLVDPTLVDEPAVRDQLADLHLIVLGEDVGADSVEVDETYALFAAVHDLNGDTTDTWKVVLTAFFQDFRIAYH